MGDSPHRQRGLRIPAGNGSAGGQFNFRINCLPGDVDSSGAVRVNDLLTVRSKLATQPNDLASARIDVNGDRTIRVSDILATRSRLTQYLPAAPLPPTFGGGGGSSGNFVDNGVDGDNGQVGTWAVFLTSPLATPSLFGYRDHDSHRPSSTELDPRYGGRKGFPQLIEDSSQRRWNRPAREDKLDQSYRSIDDNLTSDQNADDRLITPQQARRTDQALLSLLRELF